MSHAPHIRLGTFACLLLTCAVAPPLVRGAASETIDDGGGCNGGRQVQFAADSEGGSTTEVGSTETGEPTTTTGGGSCGDGVVDIGEGCDDGNAGEGDGCPSGTEGQCKAEAACGDGFVWAGMEDCDDGNVVGGDRQPMAWAFIFALLRAGSNIDARIAMMAMGWAETAARRTAR